MKCQLCGKDAFTCHGWLQRVNPLGVPGIWECRPSCDSPPMDQGDALLAAIEDTQVLPSGGEGE